MGKELFYISRENGQAFGARPYRRRKGKKPWTKWKKISKRQTTSGKRRSLEGGPVLPGKKTWLEKQKIYGRKRPKKEEKYEVAESSRKKNAAEGSRPQKQHN